MRKFDIPSHYRSSIISKIKAKRTDEDRRKKDFSPTELDFGEVKFLLARHFGFCFGVENAIEVSYRAIEENPDKRIFLLSQMIHNQVVNNDLESRGVRFIMDTQGNQILPWNEITKEDIVIVPAFGTTLEIIDQLENFGVDIMKYNTTCPFVERVWKKSEDLGNEGYTIIIHGKVKHEETRATFSHAQKEAPSIIIRDLNEAKLLGSFILGERNAEDFYQTFEGKFSVGFDFDKNLIKIGVVNQTTMLATETLEISNYLKGVMLEKYGKDSLKQHFADTRDTLCYATNDNQQATNGLKQVQADLAIVVGGYNSSNTQHIVELLEHDFPTYFINSPSEIISNEEIRHFDIHSRAINTTSNFFPEASKPTIILTSGASCPDQLVEEVMLRILSFYSSHLSVESVLAKV